MKLELEGSRYIALIVVLRKRRFLCLETNLEEALTWKYSDTWSCYFGIQSWTLVGEMGRSFSEGGR